jgi:pimeloyl-ACP methyl ester carboxylesterase
MQRIAAVPAFLATTLAAAALALPASASIPYATCAKTNDYACARLAVPLDPTGATPGALTLSVRRHRAVIGEPRSAIVALAGGPGQAAIPFAEDFAEELGPIAATRDLIVFDQRGTGESGALACKAFKHVSTSNPSPAEMVSCATQLGAGHAFYGTDASVADIEAIRRAGGYEKLVLYGTSYGTKVAELYAQAHPEHVEALILDSVVPPAGPEAFNRQSFASVPRLLGEVCRQAACRHVTKDPVRDLARVLGRVHRGHLQARVVNPAGRSHRVHITAAALLNALLIGDFSSPLRAAFVSTMRSAALGDTAPLGRLLATIPGEEAESSSEGIDLPLYYATSCEDENFPWNRTSAPAQRLAEARIAAARIGAAAFAPFDAADAIALSDIPACAYWPFAVPFAPVPATQLPAIPTLILSGAYDMRTPTSGAREVAATIPGSHLLVVPQVGHSVLGTDPGDCAANALQALFASHPIVPCRAGAIPARLRPAPPAPRSIAAVSPLHGYSGKPGRTARALQLTFEDFGRELALTVETSPEPEALLSRLLLRIGGLRAGWARLDTGGLVLHDYSFVPGMSVSGTLGAESADLRIAGPGAAHGVLRLGRHHSLTGTLGGRAVHLSEFGARAAIVGSDAAARPDPRGPAGRARRLLAQLLGRIGA